MKAASCTLPTKSAKPRGGGGVPCRKGLDWSATAKSTIVSAYAITAREHRARAGGGVAPRRGARAYKEYRDFFDHHVALSHGSLSEALRMSGFHIDVLRPRFLPYTTTSRLPQAAWLLRLYLACPPAQWLLGKQMLVVARKAASRETQDGLTDHPRL